MKVKIALSILVLAALLALFSASGGTGLWIVVGMLVAVAIGLSVSMYLQLRNAYTKPSQRIYARDFSLKFLATLMGFLWMTGALLYIFVFRQIAGEVPEGGNDLPRFTNLEYLFRSLICSLDLFMLDLDSNILDRLDRHEFFKGMLSLQAVLSFSCTVALLAGLVYSRIRAYCRLSFRTRIDERRNHLYLFFGNNTPSQLLVKEIIDNDPQAVTVVIDEANVSEDENDEWSGIKGLVTHKRKVFNTARKLGANVAVASEQLCNIDSDIYDRDDFDAFGYLGLSKIKKYINRLGDYQDSQLHIFFMGEDEDANIRDIRVLACDTTIAALSSRGKVKHTIYCHARYNGPNQIIKDVALQRRLKIKIVDSSHLAVELLKLDSTCHPVHVMGLDSHNPVAVDTALTCLVVGFGEVGRDAFRFLYEFGTFLPAGDEGLWACDRSKFDCVIVDNQLDAIRGTMKAAMPAIFGQQRPGVNIYFENVDYNSDQFYGKVLNPAFLQRLNYVVISIGDNDEAIALASRIFTLVRKHRPELWNLRIFVRCTDDRKVVGIAKIADHYNYGYGDGPANEPVIRIFGQPRKTYTYRLVVSNRLVEMGKKFHQSYNTFSGETRTWEERYSQLAETAVPDLDKLRKLRRQESQDIANALHIGTKIFLLRMALGKQCDWPSFFERMFTPDGRARACGEGADIHYPDLDERENRTLLSLAKLEHLRWNSAHELMGYVFDPGSTGCDERTMRHNCLCPWKMLDKQSRKSGYDYKKFDFCVVDTTIFLSKEKLLCSDQDFLK